MRTSYTLSAPATLRAAGNGDLLRMKADTTCNRLGPNWWPVWLQPGISVTNGVTLMYASFIGISFLTFINYGQAYVLDANLGIPRSRQGTITGNLAFITEVVTITLAFPIGVLCDRIGRRPILIFGLLVMGLSYILYPLSTSIFDMSIYRAIYAVGVGCTTAMVGIIGQDYPQEISRGKMIGISGTMISAGILTVLIVFVRLPAFFSERGFDDIAAGRYTHWAVASILIVSAVIMRLGIKGGTPAKKHERPSPADLIKAGINAGRNPRIALSFAAAFSARGDLVVLGAFTALWGVTAARELGLSIPEATSAAATIAITAQVAGMIWSPIFGYFNDRVNRVTALIVGAGLAAAAYVSTLYIDNPLDPKWLPMWALLGVGNISGFHASQALMGQEAPHKERGAVLGAFAMCGAVGILVAVSIGGRLFDLWLPQGPFVLVGAMDGVICLLAILVRFKAPGIMISPVAANAPTTAPGGTDATLSDKSDDTSPIPVASKAHDNDQRK